MESYKPLSLQVYMKLGDDGKFQRVMNDEARIANGNFSPLAKRSVDFYCIYFYCVNS